MRLVVRSTTWLLLISLLTAAIFSVYTNSAQAQPSYTINYQGKLTTPTGVAVANGTYEIEFNLYTVSSGGVAVWSETRSGGNEVTITDGLFSVMLGSVSSLASVNFNQPLYLGVTIEADAEMTPRKPIGSVPSAFEAKQLGGVASSSFLRSDQADVAGSLLTFNGGLISNSSSTLARLSFTNATGTSLFIGGDRITDFVGSGLTLSGTTLTATLGADITAAEIANGDHGFFSYAGGVASLDSGGLTSSNLLSALTDETGTGVAVFGTAPTFTTSITSPLIYGGTSSSAQLIFRSTSGGGTTDDIIMGVGTNGGTQAFRIDNQNDSVMLGEGAGTGFTLNTTRNVAIGQFAGSNASTTNADFNNYIGMQAGQENTGGYNNIVGPYTGFNNSGSYNNLFGYGAGSVNRGSRNNLFGEYAGRANTGSHNNIFGYFAGENNTGSHNNIFGYYAGYRNTGNFNEMIGYQTGAFLQSSSTVAIGAEALFGEHYSTYVSLNNVALGYRAGYASDDGSDNNILIGYQAADNLTTGNNNIIIGYDIDNVTATTDNALNIGNLIFGTGLDGTGTTLASGNVGIGTSSPASKLTVAGDLRVTGAFRDTSGDAGTNGQVLLTTGSGTNWVATSSLGFVGGLAAGDINTSAEIAAIVGDETGTGALVFANSPTLVTPNLGTPSALTLTNATGLPISGITGLGTGVATWLATPSSSNLRTAMTDETGTGVLVFNNEPTFVDTGGAGGGTITLGASGMTISTDGDGAISFFGLGNDFDENLTLNLDDTSNQGTFSSASGLNLINFSGIGLSATTGTFSSTLTMSGSAANIALGSNWLSGDGADEGVFVDGSGNVGIGVSSLSSKFTVSGTTYLTDTLRVGTSGSFTPEGLHFAISPSSLSSTDASFIFNGATGFRGMSTFNNDSAIAVDAGYSSSIIAVVGQAALTEAASGNHPLLGTLFLKAPTITGGAATVANTATLYIEGAPSATVSGANMALWVDAGATQLDGTLGVTGASTFSSTLTMSGSAANIVLGSNFLSGDGGDEGVYVDSLGNVGIGTTTTANRPLTVQYTNGSGGAVLRLRGIGGGGNNTMEFYGGTAGIYNWLVGSEYNVSGGFEITPSASANGVNYNTPAFLVTRTGNVGIGSSTPSSKLSVSGDIYVTGAFRDSSGDAGTSGQVLLTTGSGTNWVATSSLGLSGLVAADINTSAEIAAIVGDETGSGALVFANSPTFTGTPVLPSSFTIGANTFARSGAFALTLTTTAATNVTFPTSGTLYGTAASSITSAQLLSSLSDETGTGNLVFSASPTFTGTINAAALTLSSTLTMSGSAANIALGSNWLSGDGADEGIFVDSIGEVGIGTSTPSSQFIIDSTDGNISFGTNVFSGKTVSTDTGLEFSDAGRLRSGLFTEVDGDILSYAINTQQIGGRDTAEVGGIFRLDTRTGTELSGAQSFIVFGVPTGGSTEAARIIVNLQNGNTYLTPNGGNIIAGNGSGTFTLNTSNIDISSGGAITGATGITSSGDITLSGTAANIVLGSNWLSGDGADEGIFVDSAGRVGVGTSTTASADMFVFDSTGSAEFIVGNGNPSSNPNSKIELQNYRGSQGDGNPAIVSFVSRGTAQSPTAVTSGMKLLSLQGVGYGTGGAPWNRTIGASIDFVAAATFGGGISTTDMVFSVGNSGHATERMRLTSAGNFGIGTSTPSEKLQVQGNLRVTGSYYDSSNDAGSNGMVLLSTGSGTNWVATSSLGISGGGGSLFTDGGANTYLTATGDNLSIGGTGGTARLNVYGDIDLATNDGAISFMGERFIYASSTTNTFMVGFNAGPDDTTNAEDSNFIGRNAGSGATSAHFSNFLGWNAGVDAINASSANFIGPEAGYEATGAYLSNFIGAQAGAGATDAYESNFIGGEAGSGATDAYFANFIGSYAGYEATNANNSNFMGFEAGYQASSSNDSNFFGSGAGYAAVSANNSNFFGNYAGNEASGANNSNFFGSAGGGATNAYHSNFFGQFAGSSATDANNSNFFGNNAGNGASGAAYANFFGSNAGYGAIDANYGNFIGEYAGFEATNANNSNFIGQYAGRSATFAGGANFFGTNAGRSATNASDSIFIGNRAGYQAADANDSIFIGYYAGNQDSVNNSAGSTSIAIGRYSGTGGFSDSIALGRGVINSAARQLNIGNVLYATGIYSSDTQSSAPLAGNIGIGTSTAPYNFATIGSSLFQNSGQSYSWTNGASPSTAQMRLGLDSNGNGLLIKAPNSGTVNRYLSIHDNFGTTLFGVNSTGVTFGGNNRVSMDNGIIAGTSLNLSGITDRNVFGAAATSTPALLIVDDRTAPATERTVPLMRFAFNDSPTNAQSTGGINAISGNTNRGLAFYSYATTSSSFVENMRLFSSGNVGIGTTSASSKLTVGGDLRVTGAFRDSSNDAGSNGMVLLSTGSGTNWVATSSLGISGGSVGADSLDFDDFMDSMTLDAATTIALSGNSFNLDAGADGEILLGGTGLYLTGTNYYIDDGSGITLSAGDISIDAGALYAAQVQSISNLATDYSGEFYNDGNNTNRYGILIQAGLDNHATAGTNRLIQFNDGDGGSVGSINFGGGALTIDSASNVLNLDGAINIIPGIGVDMIDQVFATAGIETSFLAVLGEFYDETYSAGTNGMVLTSTGTGTEWVATSSLGISGGGGSMTIGGSITSATEGSVLFAGPSGVLDQDNANFFWDDVSKRLGLGTNAPQGVLDATLNSTATVGDTEIGAFINVNDSGVVNSGTDTTYGSNIFVARTSATGGTISNYGQYIAVVGDTGGASTNYGIYADVSGADTNYAGIFTGGNVGIGDLTPDAALDVYSTRTSGTLIGYANDASVTLAGALTGMDLNLSTSYTATGFNVTGYNATLPAVTNTGAGTYTYRGMTIGTGGALIQNTGAGNSTFTGAFVTNPNITQTTGTAAANGVSVTTGSITTNGTQNGFNVIAAGVGAGALNGVNISNITAGGGTEYAVNIGTGWDRGINSLTTGINYFAGTVGIGDTSPDARLDIDTTITSGTIFGSAAPSGVTVAGALTGYNLDLRSNYTATGQSVTGIRGQLPNVANTGGSVYNYNLVDLGTSAATLTQGTGAGASTFRGLNVVNPNITQTTGTVVANGAVVTTGTITTGGTQNGLNVIGQGVAAGTLNGINIAALAGAGAGTENAINVGAGYDKILESSTFDINGTGFTVINPANTVTTGNVISLSYGTGVTLTGQYTGFSQDYTSFFTATGQSVTGNSVTLPAVTNTGAGTYTYRGLTVSGGALVQNNASGQTIFSGAAITNANITQTNGSITANGVLVNTGTITTGGSQNGIYVNAQGVGAGAMAGIKFGSISGGAGLEDALSFGDGYDYLINHSNYYITGQGLTNISPPAALASGNLIGSAASSGITLSDWLYGVNLNLQTNYTITGENVTGYNVLLPGVTNSSGGSVITGMSVQGNPITSSGSGFNLFRGIAITNPNVTQTAGTSIATGISITTGTITTGGNQTGISIGSTGIGAGTLTGVEVGAITPGAGTELGVSVATGWDYGIYSASRLFVSADNATAYAGEFFNDGNNQNRYGLKVQGGADDASGTTYYLDAYDGDGGQVGYLANVAGTFGVTDISDIRTKTNVTDTEIVDATAVIQGLRVVDFNRIQDPDGPRITGFIAQEVDAVFSSAVTANPKTGYLGVMKDAFIPLLIKGAQEQQGVLSEQEGQLTTLAESLAGTITSIADLEDSLRQGFSDGFESNEEIEQGTIVMLASSGNKKVEPAERGTAPLGVVTQPVGLILGSEGTIAVAQAGKVPVKVNMEGGDISIGDAITLSSQDGVGAKATTTTRIVGIALEERDEDGMVLMSVQNELYFTADTTTALNDLFVLPENATGSNDTLWSRLKTLATNFVDGVLTTTGLNADRVNVAEELCVDGVCVNGDDLRALLESANRASEPEPTPVDPGGEEPVEDPEPPAEEPPVDPEPENPPSEEPAGEPTP